MAGLIGYEAAEYCACPGFHVLKSILTSVDKRLMIIQIFFF